MGKITTFIRRYFILSKRLLRKPGFVAILLLVPVLVAAMGIAARNGDSGVVTIALAMQDNDDTIANEIVDGLTGEDSLIRFERCDSPADASALVEEGSADAAWIFNDDLQRRIAKFAGHTHQNNAFVAVIQREESVFLRLSHEKLNAALYPYISMAVYSDYVLDNVVNISELSEEEIREFYLSVNAEGADLFDFVYADPDGEGGEIADTSGANFLVSPLRGLLAIMVVLGGVAVAMFYMQDEARGAFDRLPRGTGFSFSAVYHSAAVIMVAVVVFIALLMTKMTVGAAYELLALFIFCMCTVGFCICLRLLLRDIRLFGAVVPILIVVMAVLCPIFFKAPNIPIVQYLLPTYYYIRAFSSTRFVWYMAIYTAVLFVVAFALHSLRAKQKR